jgi:hypothetical protein
MIYVYVPAEGVRFAPDVARGRNILPDFRDLDIHNALKALRTLAYLPDAKIVLEGHDKTTTNQEVGFMAFHRYLQAVNDRVLERMVAGKPRRDSQGSDDGRLQGVHQSPARVITHVETAYDYLWRYRDVQTPVRAPRD